MVWKEKENSINISTFRHPCSSCITMCVHVLQSLAVLFFLYNWSKYVLMLNPCRIEPSYTPAFIYTSPLTTFSAQHLHNYHWLPSSLKYWKQMNSVHLIPIYHWEAVVFSTPWRDTVWKYQIREITVAVKSYCLLKSICLCLQMLFYQKSMHTYKVIVTLLCILVVYFTFRK